MKLTIYKTKEKPKGIIFIIHGMGEHKKRYKEFGLHFSEKGYKVVIGSHFGHGENIEDIKKLGYIEDDFKFSLKELESEIIKINKERPKEIPLFILGHSMGSFITQILMDKNIEYNGIILSGSALIPKVEIFMGKALTNVLLKIRNERDTLLNSIIFRNYNSKFGKKDFSWLTRDENSVKEYKEDEYCGFIPYTSYFKGMFNLIEEARRKNNRSMFLNKPMYIFSGEKDPVGGYGKKTKKLYKFYKKLNHKDVRLKLYKEGRHEMLNEINKKEVYEDLLKWIESKKN